MSLGEDLMKMSLNGAGHVPNRPTKPPTLGEVKKSLRVRGKAYLGISTNYHPQSLARRLIHAASQMDELPSTGISSVADGNC